MRGRSLSVDVDNATEEEEELLQKVCVRVCVFVFVCGTNFNVAKKEEEETSQQACYNWM